MVLETIVGSGLVVGVAVLAVLWNYSALPKIDWSKIAAGMLLVLTALVLGTAIGDLTVLADLTALNPVATIIQVIGELLIMVGVLQNALKMLK